MAITSSLLSSCLHMPLFPYTSFLLLIGPNCKFYIKTWIQSCEGNYSFCIKGKCFPFCAFCISGKCFHYLFLQFRKSIAVFTVLNRKICEFACEPDDVSFQIGLLTSFCLTAILGASFGSLATLFTQDLEVLQVVSTGVLVCMVCFFFWVITSLCLPQILAYIVITYVWLLPVCQCFSTF